MRMVRKARALRKKSVDLNTENQAMKTENENMMHCSGVLGDAGISDCFILGLFCGACCAATLGVNFPLQPQPEEV